MKPTPSISELYNRLESILKNDLNLSDADMSRVVDAMASVLAAQLKIMYLYLEDIKNNLFPDTADTSENGGELNRLGQIQLNRQPYPPTDGIYKASVTGISGGIVRAGLTFKSNDDSKSPGNLYITDSAFILIGSTGIITIRSLNAGPDFRLDVGNTLTATEPLIGVDQQIVVTNIDQLPAAGESIDLYRQNILDSIRLEPQGGAKTDYRIWASDAQGVQRVFPYVKNGDAGTVQVFVEATKIDSIDGNGTPDSALLTAVQSVIEFDPDTTMNINDRGRRPIQAILEVLPIQIKPVDILITGLQIDTPDVRSSIFTNLDTYLFDVRPFIAGADLARDKNDTLTAVKVQSVITDTIGNINSFTGFKLFIDGVESATFTFSLGNIPYLRDVNYS